MQMLRPKPVSQLLLVLGLGTLLLFLPHGVAKAQCDLYAAPTNMANITSRNTDGCGTNDWDLQACFAGTIYPEGPR